MAGNSSKARQAKLAKRKAKSKQKQKQGRMQGGGGSELNAVINTGMKNPVSYCGYTGDFDQGMVTVTLARSSSFGPVLFASFNIDLYCLGAKDAFITEVTQEKFEEYRSQLIEMSPESAKKLIEGAVEFAKSVGIKPHNDFKKAYRIFKDVDAASSEEEFEYGKDGKPFFIQGPNDTPARVNEIMRILEANGVSGVDHDFLVAPEGLADFMSE